ncbi:MAG: flippase [Bacteroidetes bacterium]|nr:flippase [Bacteroidota bacterium]
MISRIFHRYKNDQQFRETIRSSFSSLVIRFAGVFTGFLATVITTRYYGADALGIVAICLAILSFAVIFGKLGFDVSLMRYIADFGSKKNYPAVKGVFLKAMVVIVPLSVAITIVLFYSSHFIAGKIFHKEQLEKVIRYNSLFVLPLVLMLVCSESIRGLKKINAYTFFQTTGVSTLATILLLVFIFIDRGNHIPAYIQFVCISLVAAWSLFSFLRFSKFTRHAASTELSIGDLVKKSSPVFISTLMQLLMSWAGTLILAAYVPESEVGIYSALVRISTFTNITILAVNSGMMPKFAIAHASGNNEELKHLAKSAVRIIFYSALPIFIVLFAFPGLVLNLFGKDFSGHETPLYMLLFGQLFVVFAGLPAQILNMTDRQHVLRNISVIAACCNILFCFLLIPSYGIAGACIAQVVGMVVWNVMCIVMVNRIFKIWSFFHFDFLKK